MDISEILERLRPFIRQRGLGIASRTMDILIQREPFRTRQPDILNTELTGITRPADLGGGLFWNCPATWW